MSLKKPSARTTGLKAANERLDTLNNLLDQFDTRLFNVEAIAENLDKSVKADFARIESRLRSFMVADKKLTHTLDRSAKQLEGLKKHIVNLENIPIRLKELEAEIVVKAENQKITNKRLAKFESELNILASEFQSYKDATQNRVSHIASNVESVNHKVDNLTKRVEGYINKAAGDQREYRTNLQRSVESVTGVVAELQRDRRGDLAWRSIKWLWFFWVLTTLGCASLAYFIFF